MPGHGISTSGADCVLYTYANATRKDTYGFETRPVIFSPIKDMDIDGLEAPSFNHYVSFFVLVD